MFYSIGLLICTAIIACQCRSYLTKDNPTKHRNWNLVNNNGQCGKSHSQRIIGGVNAGLGKYPWIVRLAYDIGYDNGYILKCAGSIITKKYVVTANHCFTPYEQLAFVRAGDYDDNTDPDCDRSGNCAPPFIDYDVEEITNHKGYRDGVSFVNDITLIRIVGEFKYNDYVMPICLEYDSLLKKDYVGTDVEVAGWGIFNIVTDEAHPVLQKVTIPVRDTGVCAKRMKSVMEVSKRHQICAGGVVGKDSCGGDSGGPLMSVQSVDKNPPRYFLIGIVSFGLTQCGTSTTPAIYTRVSTYLTWILDRIRP